MERKNRFEDPDRSQYYASIEIDLPQGGKLKLEKKGDLFVFTAGESMTTDEFDKLSKDIGLRSLTEEEVLELESKNLKNIEDLGEAIKNLDQLTDILEKPDFTDKDAEDIGRLAQEMYQKSKESADYTEDIELSLPSGQKVRIENTLFGTILNISSYEELPLRIHKEIFEAILSRQNSTYKEYDLRNLSFERYCENSYLDKISIPSEKIEEYLKDDSKAFIFGTHLPKKGYSVPEWS